VGNPSSKQGWSLSWDRAHPRQFLARTGSGAEARFPTAQMLAEFLSRGGLAARSIRQALTLLYSSEPGFEVHVDLDPPQPFDSSAT